MQIFILFYLTTLISCRQTKQERKRLAQEADKSIYFITPYNFQQSVLVKEFALVFFGDVSCKYCQK